MDKRISIYTRHLKPYSFSWSIYKYRVLCSSMIFLNELNCILVSAWCVFAIFNTLQISCQKHDSQKCSS